MSALKKIQTRDGSFTYYHPLVGEHYHSIHGALQESRHVFLETGTHYYLSQHPDTAQLNILEVGFGTGLNFLVTADYCAKISLPLQYTGIEKYPLTQQEIEQTGYGAFLEAPLAQALYTHYPDCMNHMQALSKQQSLEIRHQDVRDFESKTAFDLIYFDAFAAVHQPEMWTKETLDQVCRYLRPGGILVTYAITGQLKRDLRALGFTIQKMPGAPGKREMLRAIRAASPSFLQSAHNNP